MRELIAAESPDFIMTTGDTVYGERNLDFLEKALAPVLESGVPWGFVFGNHDVEFASNREELFARVTALPGCMSYHDPASGDGVGNCVLELCARDSTPEWLLIGVDSGGYSPLAQVPGYAWVTKRQIEWYTGRIADYARRLERFSAMTFMHMALPEHAEVWDYEVCYGTKRDGIGCPPLNSGFFTAMLEAGHTKGVFVGHDHVNDYWGRLYGVRAGLRPRDGVQHLRRAGLSARLPAVHLPRGEHGRLPDLRAAGTRRRRRRSVDSTSEKETRRRLRMG